MFQTPGTPVNDFWSILLQRAMWEIDNNQQSSKNNDAFIFFGSKSIRITYTQRDVVLDKRFWNSYLAIHMPRSFKDKDLFRISDAPLVFQRQNKKGPG